MSTTPHSLPQRTCSQQTLDKAARLEIIMQTPYVAFVQGDHDIYQVWRDTLECSCTAARYGKHCSHVAAVELLRETPPPPKVRRCQYNRHTGLFDVVENGAVVGTATSYLDAERVTA